MIRLDGNNLAAFRGAGVAGTVQSVAGCELFGEARGTSPYSAAATRALKAQFPTQWPTIRDYGFAHPEIVGYMNAYAPEDAKIAYSLVEGIGTRWIKSDGTAVIDTGYAVQRTTSKFTSEMLVFFNNTGSQYHGFNGGSAGWWGIEGTMYGSGLNPNTYKDTIFKSTIEFDSNVAKYYIDDDLKATRTGSAQSGSGNIYLFAINPGTGSFRYTNQYSKVLYNKIKNGSGDLVQYLIPFVHKEGQTEINCMIDLVTGAKKFTINGGSFTISESPA